MRTFLLGLLLSFLFIGAQLNAQNPNEEKLKVLVITGGHGYNKAEFSKIFNSITDIEWKSAVYNGQDLNATNIFATDTWKSYDVFVFYDMISKVPEKSMEGIASLGKAGKGILMLHHTLAAHKDWPEYARIVGGKYLTKPTEFNGKKYGASTYKHGVDISVSIPDPRHPITYGLKAFKIHDETYNKYLVLPDVKPLLTTDNPTSEKVIGWAHTYQKSRVVYLQLGHDAHAYKHPVYRKLIARSIRYVADRPACSELKWNYVFNKKDLSNWKAEGKASWNVKDKILIGKQGPGFAPGDLFTKKSYEDFEAFVKYRIKWPANSGVWFRYQTPGKAYQADILEWPDPECWSGTLYCPGKMFLDMNKDPKLIDKTGWNSLLIRAAGSHLVIFLNGEKVGDVYDGSSPSGKLGIQVHPGKQFGPMQIEIEEFKARKI